MAHAATQDGFRSLPATGRPVSGKLFFLCAVLFCGSMARAQTGSHLPAAVDPPSIRIKSPIHDFGSVPVGQLVEHEFVVSNMGGSPLEILRVRTTCGCTAGNVEPAEIPPGGTGALRVRFSTKGRRGKQRKAIYLITNDPVKKQVVCILRGTLTQAASSTGRLVGPLPAVPGDAPARLPPPPPVPSRNGGEGRPGGADGKIRTVETGKSTPRRIPELPRNDSRETRRGTLAKHDGAPAGTVTAGFRVDPSALHFQDARLGRRTTQTLRIVGQGDVRPKVTLVRSTLPFVRAAVRKAPPDASAISVDVTLTSAAPWGPFSGVLVVGTNAGPLRRIRVAGYVHGPIEITPATLRIRPEKTGAGILSLKRREGKPFRIEELSSREGHIRLRLRTVTEGEEYRVIVETAGTGRAASITRDTIRIRTDNPEQPLVDVPVSIRD